MTGPERSVAVSVYKSLERYGCEGDRTETMRLADALLEDFVVIPKYDLPEVVWREGMDRWETVPDERGIHAERDADPDWFEARAQEYQAMAIHLRANPPVKEVPVDPLVPMIAELYGIDPENITNAETHRVGNRIIARWTERMVTNGNVTWATRASASVGRFEFGGDTGLSISEALKAATEEAESIARQMITPGEVKA